LHPELRHFKKPEVPQQKNDVAEEQKNGCELPSAGDGSSAWNWADFMPHM
jgi:hypothetical protein